MYLKPLALVSFSKLNKYPTFSTFPGTSGRTSCNSFKDADNSLDMDGILLNINCATSEFKLGKLSSCFSSYNKRNVFWKANISGTVT